MSNIYELPSNERRYDEASLWVERLDEGLTEEETSELKVWMAADPDNQALLFKMARLWDKMDTLSRLSTLFPEESVVTPRRRSWPRFATAAAVMLGVAAAWVGFYGNPVSLVDNMLAETRGESVYETAIGEHATVALADGTELVLNTNSRIRVRYGTNYRLLALEAGEVHVRVAEDVDRPLSVVAGGQIVQAVGTAFNVEITDDQRIELVVTEGKVRIGVQTLVTSNNESPRPATLPNSAPIVEAGEEVLLGETTSEVTAVTEDEIEVKLSWRNGNLIFRGESLEETVAEVERYTAVEFVIVDEELKQIRVSGLFRAGDVEGMLAVLKENFDIASERVDDDRVLLTTL